MDVLAAVSIIRGTQDIRSDRRLWAAILAQAAIDAGNGCEESIEYLTTDSVDLRIVCQNAGIHHEKVMRNFKKVKIGSKSMFIYGEAEKEAAEIFKRLAKISEYRCLTEIKADVAGRMGMTIRWADTALRNYYRRKTDPEFNEFWDSIKVNRREAK